MKKIMFNLVALTFLVSSLFAQSMYNDPSITAFSREGKTKVGGYMDTEWISNNDINTFRAHRLVMQVGSQVTDKVLFNAEIEYEYGGGEIKLEQAFVDYKMSDWFTQRSGIVVVPFGQINIYHDSDMRIATDRPMVTYYVIPSTWSEVGVGGHGDVEWNEMDVNYQAYIVNGFKDEITSSKGLRGARQGATGFKTDNNKNKAFVGRIGMSPNINWTFGGSFYTGKIAQSGDASLTMFGADSRYNMGPFAVLGEYAEASVTDATTQPEKLSGFYVEGRYKIPTSLPITLFGRYGSVNLDHASSGNNDKKRYTVGINIQADSRFFYKLEYQINEEKGDEIENNALVGSVAVGF